MPFGLRGAVLLFVALLLCVATSFCEANKSRRSGSKAAKIQLKRMFITKPKKQSHVLFTAPHSIALLRDGKAMHKCETYTLEIVQRMVNAVDAGVITWKRKEQRWIRKNGPRTTNRDPNYLEESELLNNPWYVKKQDILNTMRTNGGSKLTMHVDIHGQRNVGASKNNKFELEIGLSAMEKNNNTRTEAFKNALLKELKAVLIKHFSSSTVQEYRSKHDNNKLITADGYFSGHGGQRWTQARQSQNVGYDLSVQIELSWDLRNAISKNSDFQRDFAKAFVDARDDAGSVNSAL